MSRAIRRLWYRAFIYQPENISDATAQMDHNAVVLFTIDRLARSPRTTVRTRGTGTGAVDELAAAAARARARANYEIM